MEQTIAETGSFILRTGNSVAPDYANKAFPPLVYQIVSRAHDVVEFETNQLHIALRGIHQLQEALDEAQKDPKKKQIDPMLAAIMAARAEEGSGGPN